MPVLPFIIGGASGILGAINAQMEANKLSRQIQDQRTQIEKSANNIRALESKDSAASLMAYNWAASMLRKNRNNPEMMSSISQGLNQTLSSNADKSSQYRLAASNMMAQRPAKVNPSGAWLGGLVSGFTSGFGLGTSIDGTKSKPDNPFIQKNGVVKVEDYHNKILWDKLLG